MYYCFVFNSSYFFRSLRRLGDHWEPVTFCLHDTSRGNFSVNQNWDNLKSCFSSFLTTLIFHFWSGVAYNDSMLSSFLDLHRRPHFRWIFHRLFWHCCCIQLTLLQYCITLPEHRNLDRVDYGSRSQRKRSRENLTFWLWWKGFGVLLHWCPWLRCVCRLLLVHSYTIKIFLA